MVPALLLTAATTAATPALDPRALYEAWPKERFVTAAAPCLKHLQLLEQLQALEKKHAGQLKLEEAGRSFEGRSIHLLTLGSGPKRVLLWSQMHGDEPSATPALLDLADWLLSHRQEPGPRAILEQTTLYLVPMLNPDGAERYERRNAQAIDVNRDALNLASPEGRLLKELRDRLQPELGFNLHDQDRRTVVGESGRRASIALLAVAGDPKGTMSPGRARAKRVCSLLVSVLSPFVPGAVARYDEDWNPRAFGDNLTKWGTPVVLVESGAVPEGGRFEDLTRLNFVGLLAALEALARDDAAGHDPGLYERLPRNQSGAWADVVVQGAGLLQPATREPYRSDLAFDARHDDRELAGCSALRPARSSILEVGDARHLGAGRVLAGQGRVLAPALAVGVEGGLAARAWLDAAALSRLARLGVSQVSWAVPLPERAEAKRHAEGLAAPGRPRIELVEALDQGLPRIAQAPAEPRGPGLAAVLQALGLPALVVTGKPGLPQLGALTGFRPALAPGRPASFVAWTLPEGADGEPQLDAVWLEGEEVPRP